MQAKPPEFKKKSDARPGLSKRPHNPAAGIAPPIRPGGGHDANTPKKMYACDCPREKQCG